MFLRTVVVFLFLIFFASCKNGLSKTTTTVKGLQELDSIDFTSIDAYPLFSDCEDITDKEAIKDCFKTTLSEKISDYLQAQEYKVVKRVNDSSYVSLLVDHEGNISVVCIESSIAIQNHLPQLDTMIRASVAALPKTEEPAYKRGIPVKSQYKLAVVVKTTD